MPVAVAALAAGGCGTQGISVPEDDPTHAGAVLFSERCAGCHTLKAAGTQGSATRSQRQQGPNFDQRKESFDDALFAIQNGGFSGAIMPANIAVGADAQSIARFLEQWSGKDVKESPRPGESENLGGP
jgi:mono/diheme cytochrome c family protein